MERLDDASDKRHMAALAAGDDRALGQLVDRWQQPLRRFMLRYLQNESDADDLLQETFVRVYRHRTRYQPKSRFSTWLFTIAVNLCRNHAEKQARRATVSLDAPVSVGNEDETTASTHLDRQASEGPDPSEQALTVERAAAVRAAIEELPHDLRTVVILFEYENLSHAEIAEIVATTPKAVETRLYRARRRLREQLAKWL
jgi:RNA polymerase sigma-70 factor (ECF subfamily)